MHGVLTVVANLPVILAVLLHSPFHVLGVEHDGLVAGHRTTEVCLEVEGDVHGAVVHKKVKGYPARDKNQGEKWKWVN